MAITLYTLSAAIGTTHKVIVVETDDCYKELVGLIQLGADENPNAISPEMVEFLKELDTVPMVAQGEVPKPTFLKDPQVALGEIAGFLENVDAEKTFHCSMTPGLHVKLEKFNLFSGGLWLSAVAVRANTQDFKHPGIFTEFMGAFEHLAQLHGWKSVQLWCGAGPVEERLHTTMLHNGYWKFGECYRKLLSVV